MQGAGLNVERGIEEVVMAVKELDDVALMLVGDGDVMPLIKNIIQEHHLEQKVFMYGRRPYHEMMQYTAHADLGITMDKPLSKNYEFTNYYSSNKDTKIRYSATAIKKIKR